MWHVRVDFEYAFCLEIDEVVGLFLDEAPPGANVFSGNLECGPYAEAYLDDGHAASTLENIWEDMRDRLALISRLEEFASDGDCLRLSNWLLGRDIEDGVGDEDSEEEE